MHLRARMIALSLVVPVLVAGPLAPVARAQAPQPPAPTTEGDVFQESMKGSPTARTGRPSAAAQTGAALIDVFYVPGKAILCTTSVVFDTVILALTFGSAYRAAAAIANEGCGGKWYITGADLRSVDPGARDADWADHSRY